MISDAAQREDKAPFWSRWRSSEHLKRNIRAELLVWGFDFTPSLSR